MRRVKTVLWMKESAMSGRGEGQVRAHKTDGK